MTEPLPEAVKLLNQRLLAEGCMSSKRAEEIWDTDMADVDKGNASSLKTALRLSSRQLSVVGLEIRGIALNDTTYYAIVNKQPDEIAKTGFQSAFSISEINYIRLILEKLTDGSSSRANLINLKNVLKEQDSLTTDGAARIVNRLLEDGWLTTGAGEKNPDLMRTQLALGPRAYMELSYMLVEQFGMDKTELPQQIYLG